MTRIGFAYNQKPDVSTGLVTAAQSESPRPDEEPPSMRRDHRSRTFGRPALLGAHGGSASVATHSDDIYAEWDSPETIDAVADALARYGDVIRLEARPEFPERLRAECPDLVFNIAEGLSGTNREAHVPAICEFFDVAYSGSDPFTLSLCLHKARTKEVLGFHGIPTAPFVLIESDAELDALLSREAGSGKREAGNRRAAPAPAARIPLPALRFPLFLKPVHEGSSKGITQRNLVHTRDEFEAQCRLLLETYAQPVIAEGFLPGAEFTCGVLGNGAGARVLPLVGINFESLPDGAVPIYGFEAKWVWDRPEEPLDIFECPARIDTRLQAAIEEVVLRAYRALGCRDWARIDVRLDATGVPNVVEVNPLPGILPKPEDNSCLPKAARAAGMSYEALIHACLVSAADRCGISLRRLRSTIHRARKRAPAHSTLAPGTA